MNGSSVEGQESHVDLARRAVYDSYLLLRELAIIATKLRGPYM
jgi:hypothetical protein